jgi:hypothetical protein
MIRICLLLLVGVAFLLGGLAGVVDYLADGKY